MERTTKGKRESETTVASLELDQVLLNPPPWSPEETTESANSFTGWQMKLRKYSEDLDFKVVGDDWETITMLGIGWTSTLSASILVWQAEEPPKVDKHFIGGMQVAIFNNILSTLLVP